MTPFVAERKEDISRTFIQPKVFMSDMYLRCSVAVFDACYIDECLTSGDIMNVAVGRFCLYPDDLYKDKKEQTKLTASPPPNHTDLAKEGCTPKTTGNTCRAGTSILTQGQDDSVLMMCNSELLSKLNSGEIHIRDLPQVGGNIEELTFDKRNFEVTILPDLKPADLCRVIKWMKKSQGV
ncbi:uncharacterized protein LOC143237694 isoform X1 [Tachypleus tridentatus]|uniref:uncharacterized protein LOC143237694 isoform X1 n=2 Tax=Tachypleus tridentatus TaxID=6853 RepID=UPI003FD6969E